MAASHNQDIQLFNIAVLQRFQVYKSLAWLNELPEAEARKVLLDCCGSPEWADRMIKERPFRMLEGLFLAADAIWFSLTPADWLRAFAAHPKIGSTDSAAANTRASEWSAGEQAGTAKADKKVKKQLAEANGLYEEKFGFIFIVCATGRSAEEMLEMCKARLRNRLGTEMMIAAEEQRKITELRLNKLLENELHYNTRA